MRRTIVTAADTIEHLAVSKEKMNGKVNVRLKLVLPVVMVIASATLMVISSQQIWMFRSWDSPPPPTPATSLNLIINGPGFISQPYIYKLIPAIVNQFLDYQSERLLGVALLWFCIGRAIDRKHQGKNLSKERPRVAVAVFGVLFLLSGWLGTMAWMNELQDIQLTLQLMRMAPLSNSRTVGLILGVWSIGLTIYFGRRVWQSIRQLRIH